MGEIPGWVRMMDVLSEEAHKFCAESNKLANVVMLGRNQVLALDQWVAHADYGKPAVDPKAKEMFRGMEVVRVMADDFLMLAWRPE